MSDLEEMSADELRAEREAAREIRDEREEVGDVIEYVNAKNYVGRLTDELEARGEA